MIPGIVAGAPFGGDPTAGYLDGLATLPNYVWGLRKLISTASLCIRVRRSSDNAEQDIGFSGDDVDSADLASFIGANSGFVTAVYEQQGGGALVMATTARQPRIVNAGAYDGAMIFDGSNDCLQSGTLTLGTPRVWTFGKWNHGAASGTRIINELSADYSTDANRYAIYASSTVAVTGAMGILATRRINNFLSSTGMSQWTFLFDRTVVGTNEITAWRDGSSLTPSSVSANDQTGNFNNHVLNVGARNGGASLATAMSLINLVLYTADVSAIQTDIEDIVEV
jgi:hypothetical protein